MNYERSIHTPLRMVYNTGVQRDLRVTEFRFRSFAYRGTFGSTCPFHWKPIRNHSRSAYASTTRLVRSKALRVVVKKANAPNTPVLGQLLETVSTCNRIRMITLHNQAFPICSILFRVLDLRSAVLLEFPPCHILQDLVSWRHPPYTKVASYSSEQSYPVVTLSGGK